MCSANIENHRQGASVTYVSVTVIPEEIANSHEDIAQTEMALLFELLQWHLQEKKQQSLPMLSLQSHPFMRPCDACGIEYADASGSVQDDDDDERE